MLRRVLHAVLVVMLVPIVTGRGAKFASVTMQAAADNPIVVTLGEGHAPRGNPRVESSAKRFKKSLDLDLGS